ncbi:hypothetical protein FSP39_005148 [Pinctada imbricata]|uniref:Nucleolar protein 9 n=1 Tax=Pinctada imbricata TaxID=66713 RepID=A0AA89BWV2_PINIB|nr:hypothetical protein FSP39_005148 [Pinctada imbricata]
MSKFKKKSKSEGKSNKDRVPNETINYYDRVSQTFDDFSSEDEKETFLKNVFSQFGEDGIRLCYLARTSKILERLINNCCPSHIPGLFSIFKDEWTSLATHPNASHVLQALIYQVPKWMSEAQRNNEELDDGDEDNVQELFCELCIVIGDKLEDYVKDTHASYIVRCCLEVLAGCKVQDKLTKGKGKSKSSDKDGASSVPFPPYKPPEKFVKYMRKLTKLIFKLPDIHALLSDWSGVYLIDTIVNLLHHTDDKLCQKYINKTLVLTGLVKNTDSEDKKKKSHSTESPEMPVIMKDKCGCFLIEEILVIASEETFQSIYNTVLQKNLVEIALHPCANFILQRVISHVKDKEMFEEIFSKMSEILEDLLAYNRLGIIIHLAEACSRLHGCQEKLVKNLMEAFHCSEPVERQNKLAPLIASLLTYDVFYNTDDKKDDDDDDEKEDTAPRMLQEINYHGAVLLEKLLLFGNTRRLADSMLEMKPLELKNLSCDKFGSHVIDAFFTSTTVSGKAKEKMVHRLKGTYVDLACHRNGSRTLENIWKAVEVKQRIEIATELAKKIHIISSDQYGFHINRNFAISHFINRRQEWTGFQTSSSKKRKIFSDFLGEKGENPKKRKVEDEKKTKKKFLEEDDEEKQTFERGKHHQQKFKDKPFTDHKKGGKQKHFKGKTLPSQQKKFKHGPKKFKFKPS